MDEQLQKIYSNPQQEQYVDHHLPKINHKYFQQNVEYEAPKYKILEIKNVN